MCSVSDAGDTHYFDRTPSAKSRVLTYEIQGPSSMITVASDAGVFSHGSLDKATAILLDHILQLTDTLPPGDLVDVGCGAGPIALLLASKFPARTIWAVDTNERALALTEGNAGANGFGNIRAVTPDRVPPGLRVAAVFSNPPIRIGKKELHGLLEGWLSRIVPGGSAHLVVGRNLGADSLQKWLDAHGWPTRRVSSSKGFRLFVSAVTGAAD